MRYSLNVGKSSVQVVINRAVIVEVQGPDGAANWKGKRMSDVRKMLKAKGLVISGMSMVTDTQPAPPQQDVVEVKAEVKAEPTKKKTSAATKKVAVATKAVTGGETTATKRTRSQSRTSTPTDFDGNELPF